METRVIVCALIQKGDSILLGQKHLGKGPYPDTWHIPGGGIELDKENCEEAILREIEEESGLKVKNLKKIAWDTDVEPNKHGKPTYYIFLQYSCDYTNGKIVAGDDMHHFAWVKKKDLQKYRMNKPTRTLLEKLQLLK